jgi:serine/threonine protein kinase
MLNPGTRLGRYEVRSKLGEGGMGEVYLAQDTKLDRTVAIKVLPADLANDQSRMRRFVQEARTASSLSHPNVAHIYEIDETDGVHFIAMEYIDGETLRHRIARGDLKLSSVLEIATEVAAALSAAHAAGITHRDIKSDNVMLRTDGYVKVLDFGLAKLTELPTGTDTEAPTRAMVNTDPGTVMGTVGYMSPEQARGHAVDARTDIWSLGVVIYQMVSHHLPFEGVSNSDVIASILGKEPPPLARYARDIPESLEWIVTKALTKDPDERYQTAKELMVDLRRIKQRLDAQSEIERSSSPESASLAAGISSSTQAPSIQSTAQPIQTSAVGSTASAVSSAEFIVSEIKRHKLSFGLVGAIILIVIVAAGVWIYKLSSSSKQTKAPQLSFTRLTSGGRVGNEIITGGTTISPDGKYVSFGTFDPQRALGSVYIRQVATNSVVRVFGPKEVTHGSGITFSPDGEYLYIPWADKANPDGALFKVPVLGGTPQKILEGIWSSVSFSPDSKLICFVKLIPATGESWLVVANADGSSTPQIISKRKLPDYYAPYGPAWSPDGKRIAVGVATVPEVRNATVVEVPVGGGPEHPITTPQWAYVNRVVWMNDGSGLVISETPTILSFANQIWFVSYPSGAARPITNDLNSYGSVALGLTADSKTIVTMQQEFASPIWIMAPGQDAPAHQISTGKYEGYSPFATAPDSRIIYTDFSGTQSELWIMKEDGTDKRQLTSDGTDKVALCITPDGKYVVFTSNRSGDFNLWRMDLDGNNQKQITTNENSVFYATSSVDGKELVYSAIHNGKWTLSKISIDGGTGAIISDQQCVWPSAVPDGKSIVCLAPDEQAIFKWKVAILPFAGGPATKFVELPPQASTNNGVLISPDGKAVTYVDYSSGFGNIYNLPLDGGTPKQLTNFKSSEDLSAFGWTHDGKLIFGRGPSTLDVVLIRDFR